MVIQVLGGTLFLSLFVLLAHITVAYMKWTEKFGQIRGSLLRIAMFTVYACGSEKFFWPQVAYFTRLLGGH